MLPYFNSNKIFWMRNGLYELLYKKYIMEFKGNIFWRMRHLQTPGYFRVLKSDINRVIY